MKILIKYYTILLIVFLFDYSLFGQQSKIDSLLTIVQTSIEDSIKIKHFNTLCVAYANTDYSKAIEFGNEALVLAKKLNRKVDEATSLNLIGAVYIYQGNYSEAGEYLFKALKINESLNKKHEISTSLNNLGNVYYYQQNYEKAIEFYQKSLEIKKELGNKSGVAEGLYNIGLIYQDEKKDYNNAISFFKLSLTIFEELDNKRGIAYTLNGLGSVNESINEFNKALSYYYKSLATFENIDDKKGISATLAAIGLIYFNQKKYNQSAEYLDKALIVAKEINSNDMIMQIHENLAQVYFLKQDYKKAYQYHVIYSFEKDSLLNEESSNQIAEISTKYETEKKQKKIEMQVLEIDKKNADISKQKMQKFVFIGGFVLMLILSILIFINFKTKQRANALLAKQKEEIEAQRDEIETQRDLVTKQKEHIEEIHKEVKDSINYAERIQRSFLATKELLDENLTEYFVLFRPKDVVSGDFYWAGKLSNGNFALVTADSTGHGVPGAIMSILNISSLEKAIEQGESEPSEILNKTRETIIKRLKNDGSQEGGKDGMDASLISFDFSSNQITYSSANNLIWIIRNNLIVELERDKMPVGKHDKDQISFTQHEFKLQKGDLIYTLTDGFQDQFGGSNYKKFLSKNIKQLLVDNCQLPMNEQRQILDATLINWIGDGEQVDDITILGIKI